MHEAGPASAQLHQGKAGEGEALCLLCAKRQVGLRADLRGGVLIHPGCLGEVAPPPQHTDAGRKQEAVWVSLSSGPQSVRAASLNGAARVAGRHHQMADMHKKQCWKLYKPPSHGLCDYRPALLHWDQRKV